MKMVPKTPNASYAQRPPRLQGLVLVEVGLRGLEQLQRAALRPAGRVSLASSAQSETHLVTGSVGALLTRR